MILKIWYVQFVEKKTYLYRLILKKKCSNIIKSNSPSIKQNFDKNFGLQMQVVTINQRQNQVI